MVMTQFRHDNEPLIADPAECEALDQLALVLARHDESLTLLTDRGDQALLPPSVVHVLKQAVTQLRENHAVLVIPLQRQLTTIQAARLLDVSRPHLIQMLERGDIPFSWTGSHRRIALDAVLTYQRQQQAEMDANLTRLTQMSQEIGLYDRDYQE